MNLIVHKSIYPTMMKMEPYSSICKVFKYILPGIMCDIETHLQTCYIRTSPYIIKAHGDGCT